MIWLSLIYKRKWLFVIEWLLSLFGLKAKHKSEEIDFEFTELRLINEKDAEVLIHKKEKEISKQEHIKIIHYVDNNVLSKTEILKTININISFLENLLTKLTNTVYMKEYNQVTDLLNQSKMCKKIIGRIGQHQVFYKNTVDTIHKHTVVIGRLVKKISELNL